VPEERNRVKRDKEIEREEERERQKEVVREYLK